MRVFIIPLAVAVFIVCRAPAHADDATEAQLRAALQASTTQIAQLEDQVANLRASQAPDEAMIEALKVQVQLLSKGGPPAAAGGGGAGGAESAADKAKTAKQLAALQHQLSMRGAALGKAQGQLAAASADASTKAAENTKLTGNLADLTKSLNSCDAKNTALYNLGNQILDAFAHKDDLWGGIANREPFIGFKRVQLQNIVQDDEDTLFNNHITQGGAPAQ